MKIQRIVAAKTCATAAIIAMVTGCHSTPKHQPVYVPITSTRRSTPDSNGVWVPDQFSAYSVGRYVDPSDPAVLHDAHTLYRREQTGRWNLTPADTSTQWSFVPSAGQHDSIILRDALTAELNRQRAASLALVEQAHILDQHLHELSVQSREFHDALQQSYRLRDQMTVVSNRLDSVESQLRNLPQSGQSPQTNHDSGRLQP